MMRKLLSQLGPDTHGAVSVDWIVLTAGIIALGAGAASVVVDGTSNLGDEINAGLQVETKENGNTADQ